MFRTDPRSSRIAVLIFLSFVVAGCRTKPAAVGVPPAAAAAAKAAELAARGDAEFASSHLYGWRKAEISYREAYSLHTDAATKEKWLFTRFLIMTRQMDEEIPDPGQAETVRILCEASGNPRDAIFERKKHLLLPGRGALSPGLQLDLEENEKVILTGKLQKKLFEYQVSSDSMIRSMLRTVADDEIEGTQVYTDAMTDILARISPPLAGVH